MSFLGRLFGRNKGEKREKQEKVGQPAKPAPTAPAQPDFPLGENIISDPDIKTFADLAHYYPLPAGFDYRQDEKGVPMIVRAQDGRQFHFLIEAGLLTFDEPYTRPDGRTGYKTTEVFKRG